MFESFVHLNFSRYSLDTLLACSRLSDSGEGVKEWRWCKRERRVKRGARRFLFLVCASILQTWLFWSLEQASTLPKDHSNTTMLTIPYLHVRVETHKNHTVSGGTYLFSPHMGVSPSLRDGHKWREKYYCKRAIKNKFIYKSRCYLVCINDLKVS